MPFKVKVNSTWTDAKKVHVRVGGVWKAAKAVWLRVNGAWTKVVSAGLEFVVGTGTQSYEPAYGWSDGSRFPVLGSMSEPVYEGIKIKAIATTKLLYYGRGCVVTQGPLPFTEFYLVAAEGNKFHFKKFSTSPTIAQYVYDQPNYLFASYLSARVGKSVQFTIEPVV